MKKIEQNDAKCRAEMSTAYRVSYFGWENVCLDARLMTSFVLFGEAHKVFLEFYVVRDLAFFFVENLFEKLMFLMN